MSNLRVGTKTNEGLATTGPMYILLRCSGKVKNASEYSTTIDSLCQELQDQVNTKISEGYMPHGSQTALASDIFGVSITQAMLRR